MSDNNILTLTDITKRIYRRRFGVSILFVILFTCSLVVLFHLPKKFSAETKLVYQSQQKSNSSGMGALAALAGIDLSNDGGDYSTYLSEIIFSRSVLENVASKKWKATLISTDTVPQTLAYWWNLKIDTLQNDWERRSLENVVQLLRRKSKPYILYEMDPKTNVISLKTEFEDPQIAYDVNVFLVDIINDFVSNKMKTKTAQTKVFIEERLQEAKENMRNAELRLYEFRMKNKVREAPIAMLEEARLQMDLSTKQELYLQFIKQYELARIEELKETPILDVLEYPYLPRNPSYPRIPFMVALFFAASLCWSVMIFFVWDLYQTVGKTYLKHLKDVSKI